ncbi:MAG: hypothetical protein ABJA79_04805, partial [Parafilimonas sp.]
FKNSRERKAAGNINRRNNCKVKFDFIDELRSIFGGDYDNLKAGIKEVLNVVYHFNKFGREIKDVSASQVGDFLFFRKHQTVTDVKAFNDFKRKVRRLVNQLTEKQFLLKGVGAEVGTSLMKIFKEVIHYSIKK